MQSSSSDVMEFRCKTCDAVLDMSTAHDGVVECKFCHNVYTIPKEEAKNDTRELLAIASHELDTCSFDRAYTAYAKAAETEPSEPEAYFGMALATFKVQYLKDAAKKHLQPICHDINGNKMADDKNYKKALSLATAEQKRVYEERAEEIDAVSKEFNRLKNAGVHYDCFICVKVTDRDERGNQINTQDSYEALKLYNHLKKRGYSPFYSEEEIRGKAGAEYEATILYALYTSECMLVVCSNEEYLQTPWVKNEYSRFMELINDERKDSDGITIVFKGKPIERLPGKRALIQGVNLGNADAYASIEDFVESHTPEAKKMREEKAKRKAEEEKRILASIEEQKRIVEQQLRAQRELEEKLKNIQNQTVAAPVQTTAAGATVNSLLIRAKQEKKDGNVDRARQYYEKVIDADPQNGEAWWGMFLLDMSAADAKAVLSRMSDKLHDEVLRNRNYRNACEYAAGDVKAEVDKFNVELKDPVKWYARFIAEMGGKNEKDALEKITQVKYYAAPKSANLALAERYATSEVKTRIAAFKDALQSADTYFRLFLESVNVKNEESSLLADMTEEKQKKLGENEWFKNALKKQSTASPEFQRRISDFYDALYSAASEWAIVLDNCDIKHEDKYFDRYYAGMREDMENDPHYVAALRKKDEADAETKARIEKFVKRLYSPETTWNLLLASYDAKSADELAGYVGIDDVALFDENAKAKKGENELIPEYYADLKKNATGKLKAEFDEFDKTIHSYGHWFDKMLSAYKASDTADYLEKKYSHGDTDGMMRYMNVAVKYATSAQKKEAEEFVAELKRRSALVQKALESWKKVYKTYNVTSDSQLEKKTYPGSLKDNKDATEAVKCATEARDLKLADRLNFVIFSQDRNVGSAKSAKTKRTLSKVFTAISIALSGIMLLTAIIAALGVSPIWDFWAVWYSWITPNAGWLAFPIILGLAFTIAQIVLLVNRRGNRSFTAMRILSCVVCGVILITAVAFFPSGLSGSGNVELGDKYIITYAENDTGYTVTKFEYTDSSRTSFDIPATHNGKPITAIGKEAFKESTTIEKITIPATVVEIGDYAFHQCENLTEIKLPAGLTSIGGSAFSDCWKLESMTIPKNVTYIGSWAFSYDSDRGGTKRVIFEDPTGWGTIPSADLADPEKAAKLLVSTYRDYDWRKNSSNESGSTGDSVTVEKSGLIKTSKKGDIICTVGNRDYKKTNDGVAYAAIAYINGYTGPLLVGENENCIIYNYTYTTTKNVIKAGSFEYNGKTYYYTQSEGYMSSDRRGDFKDVYTCKNTTLLEAAKEIAALIESK